MLSKTLYMKKMQKAIDKAESLGVTELLDDWKERMFAIESVTIDGIDNYKIGIGFINDLNPEHRFSDWDELEKKEIL